MTETRETRAGWDVNVTNPSTPGQWCPAAKACGRRLVEARAAGLRNRPWRGENPREIRRLGGFHAVPADPTSTGGATPWSGPGEVMMALRSVAEGAELGMPTSARCPEVAAEASLDPGSRRRGRRVERHRPSPATQALKGEPHGCCGGRETTLVARQRAEKGAKDVETSKAQWVGSWAPRRGARDGSNGGLPARSSARRSSALAPDAARCRDVSKGKGTP